MIAGGHDDENLSEAPFNLTRDEGLLIQPHAGNTKEQAEWIVEKVLELNLSSLSLFVSPYHLLRGYCTVLAAFIRHSLRVPIIPMPAVVPPSISIPDTGLTAWQSVAGEVERFFKYQQTGDVVSFSDLQSYLDWLWKQPILAVH